MVKIIFWVVVSVVVYDRCKYIVKKRLQKIALKEMREIDNEILPVTDNEMEEIENYKDSLRIISKGWEHLAFEYAFRIGYSVGKRGAKDE